MLNNTNETLPAEKRALREWARERRAMLDMPALSIQLLEKVQKLPALLTAQRILVYNALPDEVDLLALTSDSTRHWYLPHCAPKRRLAVHAFVPGETPLRPGPFGILEPDPQQVPETNLLLLDAVIVPALLLTPDGGRLGYGGGYYDRFLPGLRPDCLKIGVLPQALIVPSLPLDPWDILLDRVITEETC